VMAALARTAIGAFRVEDGVNPDLLTAEIAMEKLQPPLAALQSLPRIDLTPAQLLELRHGRPIAVRGVVHPLAEASSPREEARGELEWVGVDAAGRLAAILFEKEPGVLWPVRNFVG
jgi:tRNA pseudouridine55 synthase